MYKEHTRRGSEREREVLPLVGLVIRIILLLAEVFYLLAEHELFNVICLFLYEIKPLGGKKSQMRKNYNDMNLYIQLRKRWYLLEDISLVCVGNG